MSTTSKWSKVNGRWTLSLGDYGQRVRVFEAPNGVFYRDVWVNEKKDRRSLRTRDRKKAERLGRQLLLLRMTNAGDSTGEQNVTLGGLWNRFRTESAAWLDNSPLSKKDDERSAKILISYFGAQKRIQDLMPNDQIAFQNARMQGGITLPSGQTTKKVRARTVQSDVAFLRTMIRWGMTVRENGKPLVDRNPIEGVRYPREKNDLRPVGTYDRFTSTRSAIKALRDASTGIAATNWERLDLALVLAEGSGRRIGSIAKLRWEDFDFEKKRIRWRAEADKMGREWIVPMGDKLAEELSAARVRFAAITGLVFPSTKDPLAPMSRYMFDYLLRKAEKEAGLPKLTGGLWHPYRRKWATEKKDHPMKDVMAAGGWTDSTTFLRSYQQADLDTQLKVMNEPRKLVERTS